MKGLLFLGVLVTSSLWAADEAAERASVEATVAALNRSPTPSDIFTADFPNAAELQRLREESRPGILPPPANGIIIRSQAGTLVISREPMGEATLYPVPISGSLEVAFGPRFVTRSVTFVAPDTARSLLMRDNPSCLS